MSSYICSVFLYHNGDPPYLTIFVYHLENCMMKVVQLITEMCCYLVTGQVK